MKRHKRGTEARGCLTVDRDLELVREWPCRDGPVQADISTGAKALRQSLA